MVASVIRFVNTAAPGASIVAELHGNRSHGNNVGFLAANQASDGASVTIDCHADRFDENIERAGSNSATIVP